jgi:hypothetical protein
MTTSKRISLDSLVAQTGAPPRAESPVRYTTRSAGGGCTHEHRTIAGAVACVRRQADPSAVVVRVDGRPLAYWERSAAWHHWCARG